MFTLTSAAARQIEQTAKASASQDMALRIVARVEGDGSLEYGMGFDEPQDDDLKLDLDGIAVVIGEEYQALLDATVLDFVEMAPGEFHFIFMDAQPAACAQGPASAGSCSARGCASAGCASRAGTS